MLYVDMLMTKVSDVALRDMDSDIGLEGDKRALLAGVAERMRNRADAAKIRENLAFGSIRSYGHPSIRRLAVYIEFRPVYSEGAIRRLIPHLVVDGIVQKDGQVESQPIRFQMDLASAQRFLKDIQSGVDFPPA